MMSIGETLTDSRVRTKPEDLCCAGLLDGEQLVEARESGSDLASELLPAAGWPLRLAFCRLVVSVYSRLQRLSLDLC